MITADKTELQLKLPSMLLNPSEVRSLELRYSFSLTRHEALEQLQTDGDG